VGGGAREERLGEVGELHPRVAAAFELPRGVLAFELCFDALLSAARLVPQHVAIPRFPAVDRDFSFLFDDRISWEGIRSLVNALQIPELRGLAPLEIFRGGAVPAGKYSLLLRVTFQAADRTLRDDEVALWAQQTVKALEGIGGVQRA
jgi:phenylalanyl-tRNA synthetase beta chain